MVQDEDEGQAAVQAAQRQAHLKIEKKKLPQRDVVEALKEELAQERQEREERLAYGGLKALGEEERLNYEAQLQLEQDMAKQKVEIDQLLHSEMVGIDQRQFERYKHDDMFMDEWTKQLIETVLVDESGSPLLSQLKDLLKLGDKELYRQVRDRKITL